MLWQYLQKTVERKMENINKGLALPESLKEIQRILTEDKLYQGHKQKYREY